MERRREILGSKKCRGGGYWFSCRGSWVFWVFLAVPWNKIRLKNTNEVWQIPSVYFNHHCLIFPAPEVDREEKRDRQEGGIIETMTGSVSVSL